MSTLNKEGIARIVKFHAKKLNKEHFSQKEPWLISYEHFKNDILEEIFELLDIPLEEIAINILKEYELLVDDRDVLIYPKKIRGARKEILFKKRAETLNRRQAAAILGISRFSTTLDDTKFVNKVLKAAKALAKQYK